MLPPAPKKKEKEKKAHPSTVGRLYGPTVDVVQGFPPRCSGRSMALFSGLWAREESYWHVLTEEGTRESVVSAV